MYKVRVINMVMVEQALTASWSISDALPEVSLETYIGPTNSQDKLNTTSRWLVMLFVPLTFSHSCPVEVLAFQDSYSQFQSRNCSIIFVSVDTRKSLWYWQSIPRKHGGLGHVDIPLLSDPDNKIAKDYGVVIEELGIDIRGMFLIDQDGIVQQVSEKSLSTFWGRCCIGNRTLTQPKPYRLRWIIARLIEVSSKLYVFSMRINPSIESAFPIPSSGLPVQLQIIP
jgi:alkyl hydroperoxide reductase subunit AhpC